MRHGALTALALLVGFTLPLHDADATLVMTGAMGADTAEVDFTVSGSQLTIKLKNTSSTPGQHYTNNDVLSGVFFDVNGSPPSLTPVSVTSPNGVSFNTSGCTFSACTASPLNIAGEWGFLTSASGFTSATKPLNTTARFGLSGAAYSQVVPSFVNVVIIGSPHYQSGPPDGPGFTIVGPNYVQALSTVPTSTPLIQNEIDFTFNFTGTITEALIYNVTFTYGSDPTGSVRAPEPASLALIGTGLAALGALRRRKPG